MTTRKKVVFLSGTRADFGKQKSLILALQEIQVFDVAVFVTGMHLIDKFGHTVNEIRKSGVENIYEFQNNSGVDSMDLALARTVDGFSHFVKNWRPDLIVVHGDRLEALAGAIVGSFNNILVGHIEGGELSGTIDELIRHSITKLSHAHFVSNDRAKKRLIQMGELEESIYNIGSPDIDIILSDNLPELSDVKERYDWSYDNYGIAILHPVTTELSKLDEQANVFVNSLIDSNKNYVVIYPNNDAGSDIIMEKYHLLKANDRFKILPSMRFEYFLTCLKNASHIIGNSSCGIIEAPYYATPTINIGTRQMSRSENPHIINVGFDLHEIKSAINTVSDLNLPKIFEFGEGNSSKNFINILSEEPFWKISHQKQFSEI